MKSEKGITLTSLIVYVVAMAIIIGIVATLSKSFYTNLDDITDRTQASKEYTSFANYITDEVNQKENKILYCAPDGTYIIFKNEHQYTFDQASKSIYKDKVQICKNVNSCTFLYTNNKLTINIQIGEKTYSNVYTLESEE